MPNMREINVSVIAEYRANGGTLTGPFAELPVLLLTTVGSQTGRPHTTPLGFVIDGDRFILAASNGGARQDPHWFHNLVAAPEVRVELLAETFNATAAVIQGPERARRFDQLAGALPDMAEYERGSGRTIPVVALTRDSEVRGPQ